MVQYVEWFGYVRQIKNYYFFKGNYSVRPHSSCRDSKDFPMKAKNFVDAVEECNGDPYCAAIQERGNGCKYPSYVKATYFYCQSCVRNQCSGYSMCGSTVYENNDYVG